MQQIVNSPRSYSLKSEKRELIYLLVLTIIAGVLRFVSLDRPTIWGDEAATYARISGTYSQLLEQLSDRSIFTPLHYQTLWWIKQGMPMWGKIGEHELKPSHELIPGGVVMTPFMLRLVPAIAGTLFIPAFYFLCRQLFGPKTSIIAAALCCFSAFFLVFSRDAKMYMPAWLFVVLNMGFFFWWIRRRTITPWLAWIFTGVIMIGLHSVTAAIVAVQLLIVLTSSRQYPIRWLAVIMSPRGKHPWREFRLPLVLVFAIGAAAIVTPTICYYVYFNRHMEEVVAGNDEVDTSAAGVEWVENYNDGRLLDDLVTYTTTTFLSGWEWPQVYDNPHVDQRGQPDPRALKLLKGANIALLVLLAIGLIPWSKLINPAKASVKSFKQDLSLPRQITNRRIIWIMLWLCVVPYAIYYIAEDKPSTIFDGVAQVALKNPPAIDWPRLAGRPSDMAWEDYLLQTSLWADYFSQWPAAWEKYTKAFHRNNLAIMRLVVINSIALILMILVCIRLRWIGRHVLQLLTGATLILGIWLIISILPQLVRSSIWMPRYLGIVMPAFIIGVAILITQQPARWMRMLTIGLFIMLNFGQYSFRVWGHTEPPVDCLAMDLARSQPRSIVAANPEAQNYRTYLQLGGARGAAPGLGTIWNQAGNYYVWLYTRVNVPPIELRRAQIHRYIRSWDDHTNLMQDLKSSPGIIRFSVWSSTYDDEIDLADKNFDQLKGTYRRVSEEYFPCYDHWTWRKTFTLVRREYVKLN